MSARMVSKAIVILGSALVVSERISITISGALLERPLPQIAPMAEVLSLRKLSAEGLAKGAE
jgi:hypothetical protein